MIVKKEIIKHARSELPNECCGFLVQKTDEMVVFRCVNSSSLKNKHFKISAKEYLNAATLGEIISVYHSHIGDNNDFSEHDKVQSEAQNIRYLLYHVKTNQFKEYIPKGKKIDLIGRNFEVGVNDCFSLCLDYYEVEHDIKISKRWKDHSFSVNYSNIWLYEKNFKKEGFFEVDKKKIKKGDGLIINKYGEEFPSHAAIYIGNDCILHHPENGFSCIEEYSPSLKKRTVIALRNKKIK